MHYAYTILAGAAFLRPASHATVIWSGGARLAKEDHRWRVITRKLAALRARGRRGGGQRSGRGASRRRRGRRAGGDDGGR